MTEKRFTITQDFEEHHRQIRDNGHIIMGCFVEPQAEVIVDLLNELAEENQRLKNDCSILVQSNQEYRKENEQLKCGNKNLKTTLKDFINICNRLQANPTDKQTLNVARDMLQNMGVDLK